MEYIKSNPNNLDKYIEDFNTCVKEQFTNSLNKIYNDEINVYRDLIESVVKLPFIQEIINENNMLKTKLKDMTEGNDTIKLEIHDKPLLKTDVVDIESIPFTKEVSSDDEEEQSVDEEEQSVDEGEQSADEEEQSADEEEQSADEEEQSVDEGEQSADEEEQSADEEEQSADEGEQSADEGEQSADEEEQSADEGEQSADEEEQSVDEPDTETPIQPTFPTNSPTISVDEENIKSSSDSEEETEVFEIEIDDKTYYCDGEENGKIYEDNEGEVGDIVGEIHDGEATFF